MNGVLEGLKALGLPRLAAMGAVALAVFALLLVVALRGGNARMGLLYADLDLREAAQMVDILDHQHIPHQLAGGGSEILVPADQIGAARLALAHDGLPSGGSIGYEIFDRSNGLLTSDFVQRINQTRALEGELARTIEAIHGVRAARVHLVLPHREPFARDEQPAQASVLLTLVGGRRLDAEEVQAIVTLVAAAVPGLRPEKVALADSRGTLLARGGQPLGPFGAVATLDEQKHLSEMRLARAVEDMLSRSLGPGHVEAEASIEMDLDQVHETQERYDPDGQVVRSTQTVTDQSRSTDATAATTSVQNNLPNPDPQQNTSGNSDKRDEETTNYEISRTVRHIVREQPQIRRISLAVMVDGVEERDAKGKLHWQPRSKDELARITALVEGAIGYDAKRGDHVEVVSMQFAQPPEDAPTPPGLFGLRPDTADVMRLAQTGLIGLVGLIAIAFVLRPTLLRLATLSAEDAGGLLPAFATGAAASSAAALAEAGVPRLPAPEGEAAATADEDAMIALANVEGQMRASSIRKLAELVDKHPVESLSIVRSWMQEAT